MVKRRSRRPHSGPAKRRRRAPPTTLPPETGEPIAQPITVFMENAGAMWPTPDSLDDAAVATEQSGVENIRGK